MLNWATSQAKQGSAIAIFGSGLHFFYSPFDRYIGVYLFVLESNFSSQMILDKPNYIWQGKRNVLANDILCIFSPQSFSSVLYSPLLLLLVSKVENKSIYYSVRLRFDFETWIRSSIWGSCCGWGGGGLYISLNPF